MRAAGRPASQSSPYPDRDNKASQQLHFALGKLRRSLPESPFRSNALIIELPGHSKPLAVCLRPRRSGWGTHDLLERENTGRACSNFLSSCQDAVRWRKLRESI